MGKYNKKVYILLTDTGTMFTRAIKLYTGKQYNHVSIAFDIGLSELYSFGRKVATNPFIGGFVRESESGVYNYFKETTCIIYSFEVSVDTYSKMRKVVQEFESEVDKYTYNLVGLLGVMVGTPIEVQYSYFCSQFVATVLSRSGVNFFDKNPALVTPEDFVNLGKLEVVYTGKLRDYPNSYLKKELENQVSCSISNNVRLEANLAELMFDGLNNNLVKERNNNFKHTLRELINIKAKYRLIRKTQRKLKTNIRGFVAGYLR